MAPASYPKTLSSLTDPTLDPLFWQAGRIGEPSAWWRHVPFAHWIVQATAPRTLVELGTHVGVSYSAFCHAVQQADLPTRCWAVDTWQGDEHSGLYGEEVFEGFKAFHDARYETFSGLFAAPSMRHFSWRFPDQSIDLLHIDGLHTYDGSAITSILGRPSFQTAPSCCSTIPMCWNAILVSGSCGPSCKISIPHFNSSTAMGSACWASAATYHPLFWVCYTSRPRLQLRACALGLPLGRRTVDG